ncbi:hypothetical protein ACH436_10095 [Isoptericola sp. NPDC019693]|uniref:hypothetical protein n=1 Tax=Isoptericola sp. NPDC019693 TaxID=3364009 RepID=UPI0037AE0972
MGDVVVGDRGSTTRRTTPPRPWARTLRPLGYLLIGLVWLAIWALVVALAWGILVCGVVSGELTMAEFTEPATSSVGGFIGMVLLAAPLVAAVAGPVLLWWIPCCIWPLATLSAVYVVRSLRPSYGREKLSFTAYGARGSSLGPPTTSNVALSLQPVRGSALTRFLMRFYAAGWQPRGRAFLPMLLAGVGWLLLYPAIAVDVSRTTNVVCGVVGLSLVVLSLAWTVVAQWRGAPTADRRGRSGRGR